MKRLGEATLVDLPIAIARPVYDRNALSTGIVHFGPGAFHRAHQAAYVDRLLAHDPRWGIAAVSLRSPGTVEGLAAQDGLYTLALLDADEDYRVLGPHRRFLGPGADAAISALLADPAVAVVSSTVTEKGYCLAGDGSLDFDHPDIVHDLARRDAPRSLIGWLTHGLAARRAAGTAPFMPMCCDNMADNGRKLGSAVHAFAHALNPALADWIAGEVRFPNTMVDSITPASDDALRGKVHHVTGLDDAVPVSREAYAAWVIEDILPPSAPDLAGAGAVLTAGVAAHEQAKLRILNGAHSSLAYIGLLRGHETVAGAMADPRLAAFIETLVRRDIVPSLDPATLDLDAYAADILTRFRNPAIGHRLAQIACDGSQKLPYRLLDTIGEARAAGRPISRLALPVAAWMRFVQRQALAGTVITDPLAADLTARGVAADTPEALVDALLAMRRIFPAELAGDATFRAALVIHAARSDHAILEDADD